MHIHMYIYICIYIIYIYIYIMLYIYIYVYVKYKIYTCIIHISYMRCQDDAICLQQVFSIDFFLCNPSSILQLYIYMFKERAVTSYQTEPINKKQYSQSVTLRMRSWMTHLANQFNLCVSVSCSPSSFCMIFLQALPRSSLPSGRLT